MELVNESSEEDLDWFIVDEEDIVVAAREFLVEKVDPGKQKVSVSCNDTLEPSRIINTSTEELLEYSNCCTLYTDIVNDIMDTLNEPNISVNSPCRSIMSELDVPPDVVPTLEVNENEHHAEEPLNDDSPSVHQDQFFFPENNNFGYAEGAGRHDAEDLNSGQRDPDFDPNTDCNSDSSGLIAVPEKNSVEGDVIEVRMRKSKGQGVKRKREQAKTHREKGEAYLGYHRKRSTGNGFVNRMIQDNPKNPKVMGPPSDSVKCKKWATRSCETVSETDRHKLFTSFWKDMSWDSKKMFICSLADIKQTNISTVKERVVEATTSRRHSTLAYYLQIGNRKVQVCKKMFLQTFGLDDSEPESRIFLRKPKKEMTVKEANKIRERKQKLRRDFREARVDMLNDKEIKESMFAPITEKLVEVKNALKQADEDIIKKLELVPYTQASIATSSPRKKVVTFGPTNTFEINPTETDHDIADETMTEPASNVLSSIVDMVDLNEQPSSSVGPKGIGDIARLYIRHGDKQFGIWGNEDKIYIGDKQIQVDEDDIIIQNVKYRGTHGLWRLLTDPEGPEPSKYTPDDLNIYKIILVKTNSIYQKNDPTTGLPKSSKGKKYRELITPIWKELKAGIVRNAPKDFNKTEDGTSEHTKDEQDQEVVDENSVDEILKENFVEIPVRKINSKMNYGFKVRY
ncbi:hypothetical protein GE061_019717 [Apolygus lucorum]|uniref:DUF8207 domain-containing protein n=1 Tax=Apolygus lucorum TaxID=248454 RepID=A0A8S9XAJ7_APOLU|nr:hypothetical protein GE061_019717 [Apolygus lucorum]